MGYVLHLLSCLSQYSISQPETGVTEVRQLGPEIHKSPGLNNYPVLLMIPVCYRTLGCNKRLKWALQGFAGTVLVIYYII